MQELYWRPAHVSRVVHVLVAVIACGALLGAERFQRTSVQPDFEEKLAAAQQMERGMEILRNHRTRHTASVDTEVDPTGSGMLGFASSSITTNAGSLRAKRTTANPNWAAVMVDMLRIAGVERGDLVAVGFSGSFPALNLAALVAADVMALEVVAISSAGASSFGANVPGFTWLDMERILAEAEIIGSRSVAASLGGTRDRALGMSRSGRERLRETVERSGARFIEVVDEISSIEKRMEIYAAEAGGRRYSAYINAGGALVSIGPKSVKRLYRPGVNLRPDPRAALIDSVTMRFLGGGTPVVNLSKVVALAEQYGLPIEPTALPPVGEGSVFERRAHDPRLVAGLLAALVGVSFALLRLGMGVQLLGDGARKLERMV
jgi:poly-gamma-glutamate system protein